MTRDFDQDVYVKDLVTGEIILASSTDDGTKGNDGSSRPSLSADGTGVAFDSRATNLDPVDTDGCRDVYVKDMAIGEITLASLADDGTKGTCFGTIGGSSVPSLNANATKVAFESTAADLDPGDESFRSDIYVKDLTTHDITLATPTMPDVIGDQFGASISADGTRVGFGSCSLCEFVEAPFPEVFLVDVPSGDVTRASSADDGTRGNDSSVGASLSADGSRVAFQSAATNLDPADTDDVTDVYVKDLAMAVDNDEDGLSDQVEASLGTDPGLVDTDVDGINDFVESDGGSAVDTDGDGIIDALDADSDGDGILDANEGAGDTDGDGAPDYRDLDSDDDGLPDALERASGTDRLDDDSDDDGIADGEDPDTIAALIRSLPGPVFRSPSEGTRTAFLSRLELVEARIAADDAAGAISDLLDLRRRVDGCDATLSPPEAPDSNDWIRGTLADPCSAQDLVREYIDLLIANLVSGATQVSAGWGHG